MLIARSSLFVTLIFLLCLPTPGQQSNASTVKPGSIRAGGLKGVQVIRPQPISVNLIVDPTVEVMRPAKFTAETNSKDPNISFQFSFGDGSPPTGWQADPTATHSYDAAGNYTAIVVLALSSKLRNTIVARSVKTVTVISPQPTPTPGATPAASPSPRANGSPSPAANPSPSSSPNPNPSPSAGGTTSAGHTNSSPIRSGSATNARGSRDRAGDGLTEWFNFPDNWWKYLIAAAFMLGVGYQSYRSIFGPRPALVARPDSGTGEVNDGMTPLRISAQVVLNPNVAGGQYVVSTDESGFVRSVRRGNV